jgi:hypothetical protein
MAGRSHRYERSIQEPQWAIRIATLTILAIGIAVTVYALTRPEARRERAVSSLAVGDTSAVVMEHLGPPPIVCPGDSLDHLRGRFPPGWPGAAQERAVEWLQERTRERWVYPLHARTAVACQPSTDGTEVGMGADGRVLWLVPRIGRHPLQLPDELEPGTFTEDPDA